MRLTRSPKPTLHNAVKITILRPVILIILLIGLVVIWIDFPLTPERVTAASLAAIPRPTPPDKETIDALVDQLKEAIADPVDDEDVVNSIIEKWDRRVLIGKTKKQVIDMFFADVKTIVKKKATQDAVWEAWGDLVAEADADEPPAPAPPPTRPRAKPSPKVVEPDEPDTPPVRSETFPPVRETEALVTKLGEPLSETIGDEDKANSIQEKWAEQKLGNKTKKQVIDSLITDVKAVVRDKATRDKIWNSWIAALRGKTWDSWSIYISEVMDAEPDAPSIAPSSSKTRPAPKTADVDEPIEIGGIDGSKVNGRFVLTDEQKRNKGESEWQSLQFALNRVKVWRPADKRQYRGQSYSIYVPIEPADPDAQDKIAGVDKAVKTIVDSGFDLPLDLRFYCTSDISTQTQAFKRAYNWAPIASIFLGPGGSPNALSTTASGFNGFDTRTIRTIHEIGHIIHERRADDSYWDTSQRVTTLTAEQVSNYAGNAFKEFVAEVFAGLMIRKRWSNEVMMEYRKFQGPMP